VLDRGLACRDSEWFLILSRSGAIHSVSRASCPHAMMRFEAPRTTQSADLQGSLLRWTWSGSCWAWRAKAAASFFLACRRPCACIRARHLYPLCCLVEVPCFCASHMEIVGSFVREFLIQGVFWYRSLL
jgi:hypothetical protein